MNQLPKIPLIDAKGISKSFGQTVAVNDIDLRILSGEVFGLVGSDGAGKTTTLRLLIGALKPDRGRIRMAGFELPDQIESARSQIGYLSQRFSLYEDMTVIENIRFFAELRGLKSDEWKPRCEEILAFVGLSDFTTRRAGQLSGGMKQKLGLASALVTRPRILLLDEPTTGVDPVTRQDFWQLIIRIIHQEETAVLLTTPYMDEAARCTRLGFMRQGKLITSGTPAELRASLGEQVIEIKCSKPFEAAQAIKEIKIFQDVRTFGDKLHVRVGQGTGSSAVDSLNLLFSSERFTGTSCRVVPPSLEDVFIALAQSEESDQ